MGYLRSLFVPRSGHELPRVRSISLGLLEVLFACGRDEGLLGVLFACGRDEGLLGVLFACGRDDGLLGVLFPCGRDNRLAVADATWSIPATPVSPPSYRLANGTLLRIVVTGTWLRFPSMPGRASRNDALQEEPS
jgi:hypothetical protein